MDCLCPFPQEEGRGSGKQISLLQTTPSQRRRSFCFIPRTPVDGFRLSAFSSFKASSSFPSQTPIPGRHGAVWRPNTHLSLGLAEPQYRIGRKRIGFPEDTSLKQFPFEDVQENSMLPRDRVSIETPSLGGKRLPDRLDRSKVPSQGSRVSGETSSRARYTLRFGF